MKKHRWWNNVLHPSLLKDPAGDYELDQSVSSSPQTKFSSASNFVLYCVFPPTTQGICCSDVYSSVFWALTLFSLLSNFGAPFPLNKLAWFRITDLEAGFWPFCAITLNKYSREQAYELMHLHYSWALHFHASFQHVGWSGTAEQKSNVAIFQWRHAQDLTTLSSLAAASNFIGFRPGLKIRELISSLYHLTGSQTYSAQGRMWHPLLSRRLINHD